MQQSRLYTPYDIKGQVALVTGASSGIGLATAQRLAEAGCNLVIVARRSDRLQSLKSELEEEFKVSVHTVSLDLRDLGAVAQLPQQLPEEFRDVGILVNNAGLALGVAAIGGHDIEDAKQMIETNFLSVVALTNEVVKGMIARNRGHIVNMSSIAAKESYHGGGLYCGSKFALDAFTTATRHELVGTNLRVTSILPGAVKTEFSVVRFKGDTAKADAVYEGIDPLTAADIADNVMYAVTRPPHVQVCDMLVLVTHQSSAKTIARVKSQAQAQQQ